MPTIKITTLLLTAAIAFPSAMGGAWLSQNFARVEPEHLAPVEYRSAEYETTVKQLASVNGSIDLPIKPETYTGR